MDDVKLINAKILEEEAYKRFGLEAIKFITLIQEQPIVDTLPIEYGDKNNGRTHNTRTENEASSTS